MAGYQILGIRSYFDERKRKHVKYDAFFEKRWRFDDIREFFADPVAVLDLNKIPLEERWNLYYTISYCGTGKRQFERLEIVPFDVDGINVARVEEYIAPILEVLESPGATVVFSGNGLHFIVPLSTPITDKAEHEALRAQYRGILSRINNALENLRLPGKADPAVWDVARILRIPGTINRKADKLDPTKLIDKEARILQPGTWQPVAFDWEKLSGIEKLAPGEAEVKRFKKRASGAAAFEECLFLKHVRDDATTLPELEWYAAASIVARFENGRQLFHEVSKPHRGYTPGATDEKLDQAVAASGPRTCRNINSIWGKCEACPHFEKITSPVQIFGKEDIPTEATGFYDIFFDNQGKEKRVPNYRDLLKAFIRDHNYFVDTKAERVFIFDSTHWRTASELELHGYAERMFNPEPKHTYRNEFARKVYSANQRSEKDSTTFFREGIRGKLNLRNGILDIVSGAISEHTPELGFTYCLPYDYDPSAKAPTFEKFLNDVTCGNRDFATTLLDFMGYLLIPRMDDHCFLWLAGSGRNGKSTFMEVLQALVGEENASAVMLDQFENENHLELMNHKLLNISEESDGRKIPAKLIATLKALSAGGLTMVNQKYEVAYKMRPTAKLVFASNVRPKLEGAGQALASRMILVPFNMQLENYRDGTKSKVDAKLLSRMKEELPGILNLALERVRLQADAPFYRVHRAVESQEEVRQIFVESDPMESWLEDECQLSPAAKTATKDLYASYKRYMEENHPREYLQAIRQFSSSLAGKLHGKVERIEMGHGKLRGFAGISVKSSSGGDF